MHFKADVAVKPRHRLSNCYVAARAGPFREEQKNDKRNKQRQCPRMCESHKGKFYDNCRTIWIYD